MALLLRIESEHNSPIDNNKNWCYCFGDNLLNRFFWMSCIEASSRTSTNRRCSAEADRPWSWRKSSATTSATYRVSWTVSAARSANCGASCRCRGWARPSRSSFRDRLTRPIRRRSIWSPWRGLASSWLATKSFLFSTLLEGTFLFSLLFIIYLPYLLLTCFIYYLVNTIIWLYVCIFLIVVDCFIID